MPACVNNEPDPQILSMIDPSKFVIQNNFMPVPQIMGSNVAIRADT